MTCPAGTSSSGGSADLTADAAGIPGTGTVAPDFELANQRGEPITLKSLRGQNVLLVFYPFAFSRVCTTELSDIRENLAGFTAANAVVLAVSVDSKFSLRAYAENEGYDFDLLADFWPHGRVARLYGVFDQERGMAQRATFVIDAAGVIRRTVLSAAGHARSVQEYRQALAELATAPSAAASTAFNGQQQS